MTNKQLDHQTMLTLIEIFSENEPDIESVDNAIETNSVIRKKD